MVLEKFLYFLQHLIRRSQIFTVLSCDPDTTLPEVPINLAANTLLLWPVKVCVDRWVATDHRRTAKSLPPHSKLASSKSKSRHITAKLQPSKRELHLGLSTHNYVFNLYFNFGMVLSQSFFLLPPLKSQSFILLSTPPVTTNFPLGAHLIAFISPL